MTKLATALKDEIRRLARSEIRAHTTPTKKASAQHRREIAELKRQVVDLKKRLGYFERQERKQGHSSDHGPGNGNVRFSPRWVKAHRERLDLSAADYAELVGVSALTIYNWEKGRSKPRKQQLAAWGAVRNLGKREAWRQLELMEE